MPNEGVSPHRLGRALGKVNCRQLETWQGTNSLKTLLVLAGLVQYSFAFRWLLMIVVVENIMRSDETDYSYYFIVLHYRVTIIIVFVKA